MYLLNHLPPYDETVFNYTTMSRQTDLHRQSDVSGERTVTSQVDFSTLYDRYAPALLGIITKIISDEKEAVNVLEATFTKVWSEIDQFKPEKQPIFTWLLLIARTTALDALANRRQIEKTVFQLTETGKVVPLQKDSTPAPAGFSSDSTEPRLTELFNSVLFKNCVPGEAAGSMGVSVELARQDLRRAMQQLRVSSGR